MEVFRCPTCYDEEWACGFHGESYDKHPYECTHPIPIDEARRIVACVNACAGIPTETLESIPHILLALEANDAEEQS